MRPMFDSLSIAVLLNGYDSPYKPRIRESFRHAIDAAASSTATPPTIEFFDPIIEQNYPEPAKYDLIVLSGGTEDPMGHAPWVLKMQDFLRQTVHNHPKQKIVGICWGHQTLSVAFGGKVDDMMEAELGVTEVRLTREGMEVFPSCDGRSLRIHEFHKRKVITPAHDFFPLAEDSQVYLNRNNTILTFQGHPELNPELASKMLDGIPTYMGVDQHRKIALEASVASPHDGIDIWRRILLWVQE